MQAPVYDKLMRYPRLGRYPFHMPGHKGGRGGAFSEISSMDITEIEGFDNLHQPDGILAEAQQLCAKTFGAEESFFMVNGSTGGILAAVLSVCGDGEEILVARNCHRSVYSALIFAGATPRYFSPEFFEVGGFYGGVSPAICEKEMEKFPHAKAIILTSPTYEGFTSDIETIARLAHQRGLILIVDEAHGAHMGFHAFFPRTALEQGADLVIQSLHKTLPSLTQTAVLHVQGKQIDGFRLRQALSMVQTSSPSYLFLGAMDACRNWLDEEGKTAFEQYVQRLIHFRKELEQTRNIQLIGQEICGKKAVAEVDLGKLVFCLSHGERNGRELGHSLLHEYGLQMEMCGATHSIAMTSPVDSEEGFLRLQRAILELDEKFGSESKKQPCGYEWDHSVPEMGITPRKAYFSPKQDIRFDQSAGELCGEFLIPYPPGAPLLVPGEVISAEMIRKIRYLLEKGVSFVGCGDSSLQKIRIIQRG